MKPIKLKINQRIIFKSIYAVIALANVLIIFYLYGFFKENAYSAIVPDQTLIEAQARQSMEDININKFNEIIDNIKAKQQP